MLNGVLESYLLYASTTAGELGQVVYNSTVLATDTIINGLLPGTTYYITLGVSNSQEIYQGKKLIM